MITVKEVLTKKEWKDFATFPVKLYKDNPYYVPSFIDDEMNITNLKKNPPAENCLVKAFLAYKDGILAGRIAGIVVTKSNELFNEKAIRFSRFDFIEDIEVAKALLDAVKNYGKSLGMTRMHGPWGFNDTDREGMLIQGFDQNGSYATYYNYPYYPEFMKALNYKDESIWVEEKLNPPKKGSEYYEKLIKLGNYVKKKYQLTDITEIYPVKKYVKLYGDKFFDCFNEAYKILDMFVEISGEAKQRVLDQFASIINPRYVSILVNKEDKVVAFTIVLPAIGDAIKKHGGKGNIFALLDVLKLIKKPKAVELTLTAVHPDYKNFGLTSACMSKIIQNLDKDGIEYLYADPTLETNTAVRAQYDGLGSEIIKRRQTFTIDI